MPTNQRPVLVHVAALKGAIQTGSRLRVQILDTTAVGEDPIELASAVVDDWHGTALDLELAAPSLERNRDTVVFAHAGTSAEITSGDWLTTTQIYVLDRAAEVTLDQI